MDAAATRIPSSGGLRPALPRTGGTATRASHTPPLRPLPYLDFPTRFPTLCRTGSCNFARTSRRSGAKTMPEPDQSSGGDYRGLSYGLQILVGVGLGYFIGRWLDQRYGWSNATVIGSLIGLAGGLYLLIKDAIRLNKD